MDIEKTINFINKKEIDSEHSFPFWHKEYLAEILIEYHKEQLILSGVVKQKDVVNYDTTEQHYPDGKIIGSL